MYVQINAWVIFICHGMQWFVSDVNCKDVNHQRDIFSMYNDIVNVLHGCSKHFFKSKGIMNKTRPGWSKYVAKYQTETQEAYKLWVMAGSADPRLLGAPRRTRGVSGMCGWDERMQRICLCVHLESRSRKALISSAGPYTCVSSKKNRLIFTQRGGQRTAFK